MNERSDGVIVMPGATTALQEEVTLLRVVLDAARNVNFGEGFKSCGACPMCKLADAVAAVDEWRNKGRA